MISALYGQIKGLQDLLLSAPAASAGNIELQSHWARYLCVVASGVLENAVEALYITYAQRIGAPPLARYVDATLSGIRNPDCEKILKVAKQFNEKWYEDLKAFLEEDGRKEAINSIIGNRHLIAHGSGSSSGITVSSLQKYVKRTIDVITFIDSQCG